MSVNSAELKGSHVSEQPIDLIAKEHKRFDTDMRAYLEEAIANVDAETGAKESFRERVSYLMKHAKRLEEEAVAFENPTILLSPDEEEKLVKTKDSIGQKNVRIILESYRRVEREISGLLEQLREKGIKYLANTNGRINDEGADKLERVLMTMIVTYREFITGMLEKTSPDYAATSIGNAKQRTSELSDFVDKADDGDKRLLNGDSVEHEKELMEISSLIEALGNGVPMEDIKQRMLKLTRRITSHMNDDLAAQTLNLVGKSGSPKYKRNLEVFNEDPLHQLELLLDITIRVIRVGGNLRVHKGLIEQ